MSNVLATLFDVNVWMALAFGSHRHHTEARREFEAVDSAQPAAFCRATQQSFLRLVSTESIQQLYGSPLITNDAAWQKWKSLMKLPQVIWLEEPSGMEDVWQKYASLSSASPKVWMDGYLAAFAQGHGIPIATLDKDLVRFPDVSCKYLLASTTF